MIRRIAPLVLALCFSAIACALNAEQVYCKASPAVMTLYVTDKEGEVVGNGTAFLISSDGLAVTAYHVVAEADTARVKFADGHEAEVLGVIDGNKASDIAIIRVKVKNRPFLRLAPSLPAVGSEAFVIGAPKGLEFSITQGIVNRIGEDDGIKVLQFSAPVSAGNSGSPLLNRDAEVVGVVSFQRTDGQNLNFATPNAYVNSLDFAANVKRLPIPAIAENPGSQIASWTPVNFAGSGLNILLPSNPGVIDTDLSPDLKDVATKYRASRLKSGDASVSVTYFEFKPGCCPTSEEIATEVKRERSDGATKLENGQTQSSIVSKLKISGAEESYSIVSAYEDGKAPVVECTFVVRKKDRLWMVIVTYGADSEQGLKKLRAVRDSLRVD